MARPTLAAGAALGLLKTVDVNVRLSPNKNATQLSGIQIADKPRRFRTRGLFFLSYQVFCVREILISLKLVCGFSDYV